MPQVSVSLVYVVLAAIANMIIGALWYSPALFAKPWMKAIDKTMEDLSQPAPLYLVSAVVALLEAYVLAHFIAFTGAVTAATGAETGFWAWLGFVLPVVTVTTLFEGRSRRYWLITAVYQLVVLLVIGAILAGHSHVVSVSY